MLKRQNFQPLKFCENIQVGTVMSEEAIPIRSIQLPKARVVVEQTSDGKLFILSVCTFCTQSTRRGEASVSLNKAL